MHVSFWKRLLKHLVAAIRPQNHSHTEGVWPDMVMPRWHNNVHPIYAFLGSLSSGRHMILNQYLMHRTADVIYTGYLPRSPRTILFGVFIAVFKNLLHANMCTFSMSPNWLVPHTSEPYIKPGSTWASNILKNTFVLTFPSLWRPFDICAILTFALEASFIVICDSESLVLKCRPRYV